MDINMYFRRIIVQSKSIRTYLENENIIVPPRAMYAYVCNGDFVWEEKEEFFKELLNATEDAELKEQIQKKLEEYEQAMEQFKDARNCVYIVTYKDRKGRKVEDSMEVFDSYEAVCQAMPRVTFGGVEIRKKAIRNVGEGNAAAEGEICFRRDGKLKYVHMYADGKEESSEHEWIEECGYIFPHPFKAGDIVRQMNNKECICVVNTIWEEIDNIRRDILAPGHGYHFNSMDLTVLNLKTGTIKEKEDYLGEGIHPYELEYVSMYNEELDESVKDLLEAWSASVKGQDVPLQVLLESYSQFRKNIEAKTEGENWGDCYWQPFTNIYYDGEEDVCNKEE